MDNEDSTLAPGFRFHPTDEELVRFYLKRKLTGKDFPVDAIGVVEIYKFEPWDLPSQSKLKTKDLEWYFFTVLDKKYGSGSRTNRATERGYWKTTGKDRPIKHFNRIVGMKKTLVYHLGRAPHGERKNWVMHEYRMVDDQLERAGVSQDAFVVCRIFEKSGSGPKNGEKYGAPLVEEEWDNDGEEAPVPVAVEAGAFVEALDLKEKLDTETEDIPRKLYLGECSNIHENLEESTEDQKPVVDTDGLFQPQICQGINITEPNAEDVHSLKAGDSGEYNSYPENQQISVEDLSPLVDTAGFFDAQIGQDFNITEPYAENNFSLNDGENSVLSHNGSPVGFLNETDNMELFFDANDFPPIGDGTFLETDDLVNPVQSDFTVADPSGIDMLSGYLASYNDDDYISKYISFDSLQSLEGENSVPAPAFIQQDVEVEDILKYIDFDSPQSVEGESSVPAPFFIQQNVEGATSVVSPPNNPDAGELSSNVPAAASESTNPLVRSANRFLANIPAPPAFAAEYPSKDMARKLHFAPQSSNAARVTAGMVNITNIPPRANSIDWMLGKTGRLNAIISAGFAHSDVATVVMIPVLYGKTTFVLSHGWIFMVLFSVLFLSLTYKIASYMHTNK